MELRGLLCIGSDLMDKTYYLECRKMIKEFIKKEYWTSFSSADLFYIMNGKKKSLFTFVEQFFGDAYGCQLFFTKEGLNYVHDILTTNVDGVVSMCDCDSLCAILIPKAELKEEEITFLRKNRLRITEANNLIIYRFKPGHVQSFATEKEIKILMQHLEYLASIIPNEFEDIKEAFKQNNSVIALMEPEKFQYAVVYRPLPYLESMPKKCKANLNFIENFKDCVYIDDECYCFASYIPVTIKETGVRPLVIYFSYSQSQKHYFKYILEDPKEYKDIFFGILYDVFTNIGVPTKMIFNHRGLYSLAINTISLMHIEHSFIREENEIDENMSNFMAKLYDRSNPEFIEDRAFLEQLLETMTNALNYMPSLDEQLYEDIKDIEDHFVS